MDETSKRQYIQALEKVDPAYRKAFSEFVIHNKADAEFLKYLNNSKEAQAAVDLAFAAIAGITIDELVNELQEFKAPEHESN